MSSKALRSLMKERQLAKRIQHQYAKYDAFGKLICTLCNGLGVKTEALWPSHLTSKQHRLSLQKLKPTSESQNSPGAKRKSDETTLEDDEPQDRDGSPLNPLRESKRVKFDSTGPDEEDEDIITSGDQEPSTSLPADFFDDPSQRPRPSSASLEPVDVETVDDDPEWAAFEASLAAPDTEKEDQSSLFAKASIIVEPVSYVENGTLRNLMQVNAGEMEEPIAEEEVEEEEEEEDPIEKKIREEKEEIMERIQNEEREQLEADDRVLRMKARVLAFRESRKAKAQDPQ
ncbi:hypothetical protein CROQUDRAFT_131513 [Cronartium quercuum f. sp. fusiforme G11]|uniref:Coiled-coil domain-containing protein 16 n=1 Tax=Cronartium quercuum f. sp. fusiforme G11 TaxID=708437 RepID=A0A9P6NNE5_9BASI|nr:hypothetical protein CROQUDRAFT_131513 [Cronartium quercuum f. sp. fusiforme G11]